MVTSHQMNYEPLNETTAVALALRLGLYEEGTFLKCKEVSIDNQHLVFQVTDDKNENRILIKQALPKVNDGNQSISRSNSTIGTTALLSAADYVPSLVPRVYYYDEALGVTIMEDFSHLENIESGFIKGNTYPLLSEHIGTFLANSLFYTSDYGLGAAQKKSFMKAFNRPDQCKNLENHFLTQFDSPSDYSDERVRNEIEQIRADESLKHEVDKLQLTYKTNQDALLHGYFHTGNIFAGQTETKIVNYEFAHYGPLGADFGQFIADLLLILISQDSNNRERVFQHIEKTWDVFSRTFTNLWNNEDVFLTHEKPANLPDVLKQTLENTIGFAGYELIYKTIAQIKNSNSDGTHNTEHRFTTNQHALRLGKKLIIERRLFTELKDLRNYVEKTAVKKQHELATN
ncbi:S-methyl-5-thioribose kinase [Bacillus nitroreducens]